MKKKKENDTMSGTAINLIGANVMVGAVPNLSGTASETTIRSNFATGSSKVGKALPVMGKVKGTRMVLGSVGCLRKSSKKLMKGGIQL